MDGMIKFIGRRLLKVKARLAALTAFTALLLGIFGGVAAADGGLAIGQSEEALAIARCTNAGAGNGGERLVGDADDDEVSCLKDTKTEQHSADLDPAHSADLNNAPTVPPGQAP